MKNDNMLNESTIRRFMKLATIGSLSEQFVEDKLKEEEDIEESTEEPVEESTEEVEEGYGPPMDRDEEEEGMGDELPMPDADADLEMELDAEEPAAEAGGMVSVDQLMSALERALEDVLGQEVEVSQDDEEELDMDADAEMDMSADVGMADAGEEMDAEEEEEDLEEGSPKTDVVEQVYARVVQRLTQESKSNKK
tara:strand:- start:442 stop:1026 length:585 start_codon:yes stop_codon:yes gene_type:complete